MAGNSDKTDVTTFSIIKSAMAAMIGIQSDANRERDFESGKFWYFFIAGLFVTLTFIGCVWLAVKYVLNSV
jgi:hypothetical protein